MKLRHNIYLGYLGFLINKIKWKFYSKRKKENIVKMKQARTSERIKILREIHNSKGYPGPYSMDEDSQY